MACPPLGQVGAACLVCLVVGALCRLPAGLVQVGSRLLGAGVACRVSGLPWSLDRAAAAWVLAEALRRGHRREEAV